MTTYEKCYRVVFEHEAPHWQHRFATIKDAITYVNKHERMGAATMFEETNVRKTFFIDGVRHVTLTTVTDEGTKVR